MSLVPDIDEAEEEALLQSDDDDPVKEEIDKDFEENDSLSDEDDSEDEEEKTIKEFMKILSEISKNPLNYDLYIKLTEMSHRTGDLDKIRQSYNLFSSVFPLSPELWLKYIEIENSLCISESEIQSVLELYKKALSDYFSSEVALSYAKFLLKLSQDKAFEIWNEILSTYALDFRFGNEIFQCYRKYTEKAILDENDKNKKIAESYMKQLRIPLTEMENNYVDFKVFFEKNKNELVEVVNWELLDKMYNRAKEDYKKIFQFEERLKEIHPKFYQEKASTYFDYIALADEDLSENVIQVLHERMVTDCCLNEKCWMEYIEFILKRDIDGKPEELENFPVFRQTAIDINNRALRNCSWNEKLYIKKMYILEELNAEKNAVQETFESALNVGFSSPEPYVLLWLEYLSYMRRKSNVRKEEDIEILRKNFDLCWNTLGQQWGVLADCNCEILQFWGRLEYGPFDNPERGKELWETVMNSSNNSYKSALWIEFIHMEMRFNPEYARKLFKKALSFNMDNCYSIISAWLRFERCNGSLSDLDYCQKYCDNFIKDYDTTLKSKFPSKTSKSESSDKRGVKRKGGKPPTHSELSPKKVKTENPFNKEKIEKSKEKVVTATVVSSNKSKVKKDHHENDEIDLQRDHLKIFLSNLDYDITEDDIKSELSELDITNIDLIRSSNGRGRGFGYIELSSENEVQKALQFDRKMIKGRPLYVSSVLRDKEQRKKFKYSEGLEPKKLFVKGVPYDATKEELENLFKTYGEITDIRIVYHKSGKPKGIAYVEYENETSASTAVLKMDGTELRNNILNIAISAPPVKQSFKEPIKASKLNVPRTSARPRMNLIPFSVQRNFVCSIPKSSEQINGNPSPKSNEDFRKLLNK